MHPRMGLLSHPRIGHKSPLQPVLNTSFLNDDSPNQTIKGFIASHHQGFWSFIGAGIASEWRRIGRLSPVGLTENYGLHYLLHDRFAYKLILVVLSILAVLCMARVLVVMSVPVEIALLGAALTSVAYQLHNFHDPLLAYAGITQLVTILYALSVLAFVGWVRTGGVSSLALALFLMVMANLVYESAYPLVVLHVAVVVHAHRRWRTLIGPLLVTALFVAPSLVITSGSQGAYRLNLSPVRVPAALGRQLSAPLPLANFLDPLGPRSIASTGVGAAAMHGFLISLLLLPLLLAAVRVGRRFRPGRRDQGVLSLVCLTLFVLPAGLLAVATGYQSVARWGVGYLPVFYGDVAVGIGGAVAVGLLSRRIREIPLVVVIALMLGVVAAINSEGSERVVSLSRPVAVASDEIVGALDAGLLNGVPAHTMLLFDRSQISYPNGPWIAEDNWGMDNWFYSITGRWMRTLPINPAAPVAAQCQDNTGAVSPCVVPADPVDWVKTAMSAQGRWILMTPISAGILAPQTDLREAPAAGHARLAIRSRSSAVLATLEVQWLTVAGTPVVSTGADLALLRQEGDWSMIDVAVPNQATAWSGSVEEPSR